jgi:cysteine desulfurase / selenocysteine lyase
MDRAAERGAIVTVATAGRDPANLKLRLRARRINTSVSDRDDAVIDMDEKRVTSVLRFSPHYYNTEGSSKRPGWRWRRRCAETADRGSTQR